MNIEQARLEFEAEHLRQVEIRPATEGDGWMIVLFTTGGGSEELTDHGGHPRIYHDLDHATRVARDIGFQSIRVEERF
jgi:hypothetical protein